MGRILPLLGLLALAGGTLGAQNTIQATGTATLNVTPDQVQLDVTVITQANTAAQAGAQNAQQTSAMITALQQVLGKSGALQTISYSISPRYSTGQAVTIVGYTAQNTILVTSYDLTLPGALIDAANQAGAGSIGSLNFGLQNSDPSKQQALTAASKQALAHAAAIASGLGVKAGAVLSAVESATVTGGIVVGVLSTASTPVLTGAVSVTGTVTVTVQLQ